LVSQFGTQYYCAFASQYISFLERDEKLVGQWLSLEDIRQYGIEKNMKGFVNDVYFLQENKKNDGSHDLMWDLACSAPHRFANFFEQKILTAIIVFKQI
jgi:hypothetical protein